LVLVDTSYWIDHFRKSDQSLLDLANADEITMHPAIIGELALGNLKNRELILTYLKNLAPAPIAHDHEVLHLIEAHGLQGKGIGWVDTQLLASALLGQLVLRTKDKRLATVARELGVD
jgi:predicted nucleic acid-binding protein